MLNKIVLSERDAWAILVTELSMINCATVAKDYINWLN